jgi:hypothetical protein
MREPAFTESMQIAIAVYARDAAMRTYVDDYGLGPRENATGLREYGGLDRRLASAARVPHPIRSCTPRGRRNHWGCDV